MKFNYKILLYIIGFFVLLAAIYAIIAGLSSPNTQNSGNQNLSSGQASGTMASLQLSDQEEASIKEFVKNVVTLYNNYSYADFSNLTALGDYETEDMQQKTLDYISQLQAETAIGFRQVSQPDLSSFSYQSPNLSTVIVTLNVKITDTYNTGSQLDLRGGQQPNSFTVTDILTLKSYGQSWLIDDIQIKNNNK